MRKFVYVGLIVIIFPAMVFGQMMATSSDSQVDQPTEVVESTPASESNSEPDSATSATEESEAISSESDSDAPVDSHADPQIAAMPATAATIAQLERAYFVVNGKYLQILPGNHLPEYETSTVAELLGSTIPENASVDVYEAPEGKGFQINYIENGQAYTVGYGPEAADRTYSRTLVGEMASSSEEVLP